MGVLPSRNSPTSPWGEAERIQRPLERQELSSGHGESEVPTNALGRCPVGRDLLSQEVEDRSVLKMEMAWGRGQAEACGHGEGTQQADLEEAPGAQQGQPSGQQGKDGATMEGGHRWPGPEELQWHPRGEVQEEKLRRARGMPVRNCVVGKSREMGRGWEGVERVLLTLKKPFKDPQQSKQSPHDPARPFWDLHPGELQTGVQTKPGDRRLRRHYSQQPRVGRAQKSEEA